jgi:hypothetical protein
LQQELNHLHKLKETQVDYDNQIATNNILRQEKEDLKRENMMVEEKIREMQRSVGQTDGDILKLKDQSDNLNYQLRQKEALNEELRN